MVIQGVGFTEAKSGLSGLMTEVVHRHRPELIERHGGKEAAVLMSREDLVALLSDYRFRPRVALGGGEASAVLEDLGIVAAGADFEEAMENLVRELRDYAHDFLVERPSFYRQTSRVRHEPWLLRFALTPPGEQLALLYDDSRIASEELLTEDAAVAS
jgi:antitoxin YefM